MKVKSESEVAQSCLTLSDPMDCSLPGSSVHGIFQARVLEWGAISFSCRPILKYNEALHFTKDPMLGCHSHAPVKDSKCLLSVSVPSCYCLVSIHSPPHVEGCCVMRWFYMTSGPLDCDKNEVAFKNEAIGELPGGPVVSTLCSDCQGPSSISGWGTKTLQGMRHAKTKQQKNEVIVLL